MVCTIRQYLSPYADGELDSPKAKEIKGHLKACVTCREELNFMLKIRSSLKLGAAAARAPRHLKVKILSETPKTKSPRTTFLWNFAYTATLAVTIVLAVVLISYNYWPLGKGSFPDLVDKLVAYHTVYGPGGKPLTVESSDSKDAELWFNQKLDLAFLVPNAAFAGYELKGADSFEYKGRKFAYLKYQKEGKIIGYIIFKDEGFSIDWAETVAVGEIELQIGKRKETNLAVWKKGGLVYLILTNEDRSELLEYAERCIQLF